MPFKIERYSCQGPNIALDNLVNYCMTNSNVSDVSQSTAILLLSRRSARFLLIVDLLALLHQLALLGSSRLLVPSHPEKSSRPLTRPQKLTNCRLPTTWKTALRKFESLADGLPQLICWWRLLSPHGSPSAGPGCGVCCAVGLSSNSLLLSSPVPSPLQTSPLYPPSLIPPSQPN